MRSGAGWLVVITTAAAGVALAQAQPTGMSSTPSPGLDGGAGAGIALDGGVGGGVALQPQPRVAATQPVTAPQQAAQPGTTDTNTQTARMVTPGGFVVPVPQQPAATQQQGGGTPLPGGAVVVQGYGMSPAGVPILAPGLSDGGADTSTLSGAGPTVSPGPAVGAGPEVGTGPEIGSDAGVGIGIR